MSNSPSSRVAMRVQPSALVFVILIFAIGALLLISNSAIDPKAGVRPQPSALPSGTAVPVDVFATIKYTTWKSPEGLIQLEYPDTWTVQPDPQAPLSYFVLPANRQDSFIRLQMAPVSALGLPNLPANASTGEMLKQFMALPNMNQPNVPIEPAQTGNLKGNSANWVTTRQTTDQGTIGIVQEIWFIAIDPANLLVIIMVSNNADWPKMQPIADRLTSTLQVDVPNAVKTINSLVAASAGASSAATPSPR